MYKAYSLLRREHVNLVIFLILWLELEWSVRYNVSLHHGSRANFLWSHTRTENSSLEYIYLIKWLPEQMLQKRQ